MFLSKIILFSVYIFREKKKEKKWGIGFLQLGGGIHGCELLRRSGHVDETAHHRIMSDRIDAVDMFSHFLSSVRRAISRGGTRSSELMFMIS